VIGAITREYIDVLWDIQTNEIMGGKCWAQAQDWYQSTERPHHILKLTNEDKTL